MAPDQLEAPAAPVGEAADEPSPYRPTSPRAIAKDAIEARGDEATDEAIDQFIADWNDRASKGAAKTGRAVSTASKRFKEPPVGHDGSEATTKRHKRAVGSLRGRVVDGAPKLSRESQAQIDGAELPVSPYVGRDGTGECFAQVDACDLRWFRKLKLGAAQVAILLRCRAHAWRQKGSPRTIRGQVMTSQATIACELEMHPTQVEKAVCKLVGSGCLHRVRKGTLIAVATPIGGTSSD